jgi:formiminotetrahydrofolate cyclodeaminase
VDAPPTVRTLQETVASVSSGRTPARGGAASALAGALAAAIVESAAQGAHEVWAEAEGVAAEAVTLRQRLIALAQEDADAYAAALDARSAGDKALGQALERAAQVPLEIADTALQVVRLAASVASRGEQALRADVVAAATLAEAVVRATGGLVAVNLGVRSDDERLERARALEAAASSELRPLFWPD